MPCVAAASRSPSPGRRSTEPRIHGLDPGAVDLEVAGVRRRYSVRRSGGIHHVNGPDGQVEPAGAAALSRAARGRSAEGALIAPMPGKVIKLAVAEGATVGSGDVLIVLEAMKMEHELLAPAAGTVTELRVAEGDQVDAGAALAVIEPAT